MNKTIIITILSGWAALLLAGCDIKDPIYNTPHPATGKVTLTTDWTGRGAGIEIPASYTVAVGNYTATVSGATNAVDNLFEPGSYRAYIYNTTEHITVSGATVTLTTVPGNADGLGTFVHNAPGWLFTSTLEVAIEKDTDHELFTAMRQQVRQLTLVIEPTGGTAGEIESISGYLSGVAGVLDMDADEHGTPANVALEFAKITTGPDAGKWSATVRLLGTAGAGQRLTATLKFTDGTPADLTLDSDLSAELSAFNTDKRTPLTLGGKVVETPTEAGFTTTITDWKPVKGGSGVAN